MRRAAPLAALSVAVLAGLLAWGQRAGVTSTAVWERAENGSLDLLFLARGERRAGDRVAVVLVDDRTMREAPDLLERRAENARLVRALHEAGAKVIALDLLLVEPERLLPGALTADLDAWIADPEPETPPRAADLLARTHTETTGDAVLEAAIRASEVLLAVHAGELGGQDPATRALTRGTYGQVAGGELLPEAAPFVLTSDARFNDAAARLGGITVWEDATGSVRAVPLGLRVGPRLIVPFGLAAVAALDGTPRGRLAFLGSDDTVRLGDRRVVGDAHQVWLNWRGREAFAPISAVDVLRPGFDPARVRGRIVMVGYSWLASDTVRTPFGPQPGVFVHATAADNLLADDFLRRAPVWADALLALGCGLLIALGFVAPVGAVGPRAAGVLAAGVLAVGAPWLALARGDVWIGVVAAGLATGGGALAAVAAAWIQDGARARALRRTFAHYVSDDLIAVMVADPDLVQLRGQRRTLSVLFSDIRDFTSFAERIPPLELAAFLAAYLTPMTRAVFAQRGYVDKFIGDAVMALFGAPVPDADHAAGACRAALAMWRALDEVRPAAAPLGIELAIGVGINTGEVAVGNMGSAERFEYTVLGDAVNLASRLEGLTKTYGVFCLIGPGTAAALPPSFQVRRVDLVRVKGKAAPVEIFELCGEGTDAVVRHARPELWDPAVDAWRGGDLARAREGFLAFQQVNPADPVVALYLERLDALGEMAPPGWDGVFTHSRK